MAGDSKKKEWVLFSFTALLAFSVSVAGQGMRTPVELQDPAIEIQHSGPMPEKMGRDPGSLQAGRATVLGGPLSGNRGDAAGGERKDLTAFFVIGIIVNILLISIFLFWAVGQWRKTKQE